MSGVFFILGLLVTFGAVGTLDHDPEANVLVQTALALAGIAIMAIASRSLKDES